MSTSSSEQASTCPLTKHKRSQRLVILRGPPGCGKSTYALSLLAQELDISMELLKSSERRSLALAHICSTDDFFIGQGEIFEFDGESLQKNHSLNQQRVDIALHLGITPVVVDNTNMQLWEMRGYAELAVAHRYTIQVINPQLIDPSWNDIAHLLLRNEGRLDASKNVPMEVFVNMLSRYEVFDGNLDQIFNARRPCQDLSQSDTTSSESDEEYRIDPADGRAYTLEDFIMEYGGSQSLPPAEWISAAPAVLHKTEILGSGSKSRSISRSRSRSRSKSVSLKHSQVRACSRHSENADLHPGEVHALHEEHQQGLLLQRAWQCRSAEEFGLDVQEDEHLCILNVSEDIDWSQQSAQSLVILKESRGTVYEKTTGRAICVPFFKFWNHGERYADPIDWQTAVAEEKVDGNLMKLFFFDGKWRLASNRTLNVHEHNDKYACTGRSNFELFSEAAAISGLNYELLDPACCYMFERVHPDFRIVIDYSDPLLYHIGTRDMRTLQELDVDVGVRRPKRWTVRSAVECQALLDSIPGFVEGFVVRDSQYRRQKWKRRDYVALHSARFYVGSGAPCYAWVARCMHAGTMDVHRLCLNVWLRREESEFTAYFPEASAQYNQVARILEAEGFMAAALADNSHANPREREPGTGKFVYEGKILKELIKHIEHERDL